MNAEIESDKRSELEVTLLHALPGRLRIHLSGWKPRERDAIQASIERGPGIISARATPLTGNILVRYDSAITDDVTVLQTIRTALALSHFSVASEGDRRKELVAREEQQVVPDPIRVVMPVLHLVYSCSPVGVVKHLAEIVWHGSGRGDRRQTPIPVLHLLWSCSPLGLALHAGELAWAVAPFVLL